MKKITTIKPVQDPNRAKRRQDKLLVCAYCRVSTMLEGQQNSFEAQIRHYTAFIGNHPDWQMAGIYADEGISGKSKEKRSEFLKMIEDAKNHKINLIITKSINRFARNTTDCIEMVRFLKSIGVGVLFEKENINTLGAESELMLTILSSIAAEELISISQNMRWVNKKNFKEGKLKLVAERFMGYDSDHHGGLIINKAQAIIVKKIFNDCLSGLGVSRIARGLEAEGFHTISGHTRWSPSVVLEMLKNEKYAGDALLQKTITTNDATLTRKVNRGEAPKYYIKDNHTAIIEREQFDKVQELLKERSLGKGYTPETAWKYQNRYPFSQKIECGNCHQPFKHLIRNSTHPNRQSYWGCSTSIVRKISTCDMKPIKNTTLEKLFIRVCHKLQQDSKILEAYATKVRKENATSLNNELLMEINKEMKELLSQEHVLLGLYERGVTDPAIVMEEHKKVVEQLGSLKQEQRHLTWQIENQDDRLMKTAELIAFFNALENPIEAFDEKQFNFMVDKIVVKERECLLFYLTNGLILEERYMFQYGKDKV